MLKKLSLLLLVLALLIMPSAAFAQDPPTEPPTEEQESSVQQTEEPTPVPTEEVTEEATEEATEEPTEEVTEEPTEEATEEPTEEVTEEPTEEATEEPTEEVTEEPTEEATPEPTEEATEEPTEEPTAEIPPEPPVEPTEEATEEPTKEPTATPEVPTAAPTEEIIETPTITATETVSITEEVAVDEVRAESANNVSWGGAYQIQNLEGQAATVTITYYDQGSPPTTYSGSVQVNANSSKTVFPFTSNAASGGQGDDIVGPSSFTGSAVLQSDRQIVAVWQTTGTAPGVTGGIGAATAGFSEGSLELNIPLVACNYFGYDTWFSVQNAGSGDASITVQYVPGAQGVAQSDTAALVPGAAKIFNQKAGVGSTTKTCDQLKDGSGYFIGSAKITSNVPVVASSMFLGPKTLSGYNGFTSNDTANSLVLPLVMANNGGAKYYTGIQIQNTGNDVANVVVDYGPNTAGSGNPADETVSIPANQSVTILQAGTSTNNWPAIGQYVGGATIVQNGTSQPLAAIVNQTRLDGVLASAYEGFNPSAASTTIQVPLVAANNAGYYSGIQIIAVSGNPSVQINYSPNTAGAGQPTNETAFSLTAGSTRTFIQSGGPGGQSGVNNWNSVGRYVGSATITATGGTIAAIANFVGPGGDQFYTSNGFNQ